MLINLSKNFGSEKVKKVMATTLLFALTIFAVANVYAICDLLGITLAPEWYVKIVNILKDGGGVAAAFMAVAGITVPAWILVATAGLAGASL